MERKDQRGKNIPFSVEYVKENGAIMDAKNVILLTSYHGGTANIKFMNGQIRKIKLIRILKINDKQVYH